MADALGFEGKMTQCLPGAAMMRDVIEPVLKRAGPLPHAAITAYKTKKKQGTRLLKCECVECGYVVRTTAKWIDTAGAPFCGTGAHGRMICDNGDEDGEE